MRLVLRMYQQLFPVRDVVRELTALPEWSSLESQGAVVGTLLDERAFPAGANYRRRFVRAFVAALEAGGHELSEALLRHVLALMVAPGAPASDEAGRGGGEEEAEAE